MAAPHNPPKSPSLPGGTDRKHGTLLFLVANLDATGGGNCVAAWALQALCGEWDITILCAREPDFGAVDRYYGTRLGREHFTVITLSALQHLACRLEPDPNSIWPLAFLVRKCQRIARDFDAVMTTANEIDLGRPGIQYTHYPIYAEKMPLLRKYAGSTPWNRLRGFLRGEFRPWVVYLRSDPARIEQNLFLANSKWTADVIRGHYAVEPTVLYPPVRLAPEVLPWQERQAAFAVLGRVSVYKRQLLAIDTVEQVRQHGHAVNLHIVGDPNPKDEGAYFARVEERAREAGPWVHLHPSVTRGELDSILSRCRFGLHMREEEHFGIAIAEMMSFGCIPFVPNSGGQVEIVGRDSGLAFDSPGDAVSKICRLLEDEQEQRRLSDTRRERARMFGTSEFSRRIREIAAGAFPLS